jgi:hypothetical protein
MSNWSVTAPTEFSCSLSGHPSLAPGPSPTIPGCGNRQHATARILPTANPNLGSGPVEFEAELNLSNDHLNAEQFSDLAYN